MKDNSTSEPSPTDWEHPLSTSYEWKIHCHWVKPLWYEGLRHD